MRKYICITTLSFWLVLCFSIAGAENYPVTPGAPVSEVLEAYFVKLSTIYPPGSKPGKDSTSLTASSSQAGSFWKLKPKDVDVPAMRSSMFFAIYQPQSWEIIKVQEAGDFARAEAEMQVGSPTHIRLHQTKRDVQYTFVRVNGNWYITGFKDKSAKAPTKEVPPEQPVVTSADASETLTLYLKQLQDVFAGDNSGNPANHFTEAIRKTEGYWQSDKGKQRAAARSVALFATMQPTRWSIDRIEASGTKATATVSITPGSPMMAKLGDKSVSYELVLEEGKWFLADYTPPTMK